jgi:amino acid adenylation domain-containing protein
MTTVYSSVPSLGDEQNLAAPAEESYTFPLSFAQQRLWFIDRMEPDGSLYNMPFALTLTGELKVDVLERALYEVLRRHESLRTTFAEVEGEAMQIVRPATEIRLDIQDLAQLPEAEREREALRLTADEARRPFDLSTGPLLRVSLLRTMTTEHVLLVTMHHIISDGWSLGVLVKEVAALYEAFAEGRPSPLVELDIQYADFAVWQREWLQGEVLEGQLSYWREQLQGAPAVLELPTDRPRPPVQTFRGDSVKFTVTAELSDALRELSRREGATLYMTLLAAWQALLARYSGQADVLTGTPIAGRNEGQTERLIGFFVNTLVLRANVEPGLSFRGLLRQVREATLGAYAHQDLPFERLVEALQPERSLSHSPLFQVMFALQNAPMGELRLAGLTLKALESNVETAKFDLTLSMQETGGELSGSLSYNVDLFDRTTAERMVRHYLWLLKGVAGNPDARLADLSLMDASEERRVLTRWNSTQSDYASDKSVAQLFAEQAERSPSSMAVVSGEARLSYGELNERANQLAHYLRSLGVGTEVRVGILLERSAEMVVGLLGVLKAGGAYVPLDPAYPQDRLAFTLEDSNAHLLLTERRLVEKLPGFVGRPVLCLDTEWDEIARCDTRNPAVNPAVKVSADNLAYVIYTSGSSGRPKGVEVTHRGLLNLVHWHLRTYAVSPRDRATQLAGVGFDASVWELWPYLSVGASIHFPEEETRAAPERLRDWLVAEGITLSFLPTPLAEAVLALEWPGRVALRTLLTGGDQLHHYPSPTLGFAVANHYGPTESTVVASCAVLSAKDHAAGLPPIGRPISNTQIYLLDQQMRPVPAGVPGELYIGGASLARGYLGRPSLTAEKFIPDPFSTQPGARLYRTGDLARHLPDGQIEFRGRIDTQVKLRGFRIELGEIETCLMQHPAVRDCAVTIWADETGDKRLVAYVAAARETNPTPGDLRARLQEQLPDYMLPSAYVFLDELPLTPSGKIDRRALPAPATALSARRDGSGAALTPVEEILSGIWSEVLRAERVGADDNFFELGGHSLQATQVISRVREAFQLELPLRLLFESPTITGMAAAVESGLKAARGARPSAVRRVSHEQPLPLSFAQQRLWFIDRMETGSPFYNMPVAILLTGRLDLPALERTLNEVLKRHESLRTSFIVVDEQPMQVVNPARPVTLPVIDLAHVSQHDREAEAQRLAAQEAARPFDLGRGPLLRATLLRLSETEHVLLVTMHHIISDGWSMGVLVKEVAALYEAFAEGRPSPLVELDIQYADFAVWQREWLQGDVLEGQLSYWREQLQGAPAVLELPTDRPRPPVQTFRGAHEQFELEAGLTDALRALSRREGVTLFMTLLAAWQALLARYSGQTDVVVGSPIANRNRRETESLIGFFVNTLVLRTDLSGDPTFKQLLSRVREVTLGAYAHQDLPFERLVEELQPERSLSHTPLFQVFFVLQNASGEALEMQGLTLTPLRAGNDTAKFDLMLSLEESGAGVGGAVEYSTDLFDAGTIRRMCRHYATLLAGIAAQPEARLSTLPLLAADEEEQLLVEWNRTQAEFPREQLLHQLFEEQARRTPGRIALVAGDEEVSYGELNRRANRLAHHLRKIGVSPESVVGICLERSAEMVAGVLAVLKAGGAYLPLDPEYPQERIRLMLEDAGAQVLLTQERLQDHLPAFGARLLCLDRSPHLISAEGDENPRVCASQSPSGLAYVIYTSGSTGRPKGVQISHRNIVNFLESMRRQPGLNAEDKLLAVTTLCFDIAGLELYLPLSVGARVILASREVASDGTLLLETLLGSGANVMQATPATWRMLVEAGWSGTKYLKMLCGGEALPRDLANQMLERGGELWNMYGPTETTIWSAQARIASDEGTITVGRPAANTQVYILDPQLNPVPVGVPGELLIGGDGLARGYRHRADLTGGRFIPDPFSRVPGARLYRTGDSARYLTNGEIEVLGRADHQVKLRGFRIEPGEIEAALLEHPLVRDAVVVARDDVPGNKRLVAYVTPDTQHAPEIVEPGREQEHVSQWQAIWDATYQPTAAAPRPTNEATFNLSGWNSAYTGQPIPEAEMREWVGNTVERILSLRPERVLEIGCGTGLLLFRVAPHCAHYCGTDISVNSLSYIRRQLDAQQLSGVTLMEKAAHDFDGIAERAYDVVVLNSVAQYFPGVEYLVRMLTGAVKAVRPGGAIFLGDIRSLPLLEAFHASVELQRAAPSTPREHLSRRVKKQLAKDKELILDPAFFFALRHHLPEISHVEILHKRGRYHNELTRFRYDVVLRVGREVCRDIKPRRLKWDDGLSLPAIRRELSEEQPEYLTVAGVPNARVTPLVELAGMLSDAGGPTTVAEVGERLERRAGDAGIDPEAVWKLGDELPYSISLHWAGRGADDRFDVVFKRRGASPDGELVEGVPAPESVAHAPWSSYANNPMREVLTRDLAPQLRSYLREKLPAYMVPSACVVLEAMPLTPNGKVNRHALPAPEQADADRETSSLAPRDLLEHKLVRIWEELLEVRPVGVKDDFFELGGHSMLAVRLMARIEQWLGVRLPVAAIFRKPTVAALAGVLREQADVAAPSTPLVEIQSGAPARPPFFCVHPAGGGVLCYAALARHLGQDQPFYGLQARPPEAGASPLARIEEMADSYVEAIKSLQPEGPYLLGGWSMGGVVAFEMARQLQSEGHRVALLALLDARVPHLGGYDEADELSLIASFVQDLGLSLDGTTLSEERLHKCSPEELLAYVMEQARASEVLPPDMELSDLSRRYRVFKTNVRAMLDYVPQAYAGRVALFTAGEGASERPDPSYGWSRVATAALEIYGVPGDHFSMVRRPHVETLASRLNVCLDAAMKEGTRAVAPVAV